MKKITKRARAREVSALGEMKRGFFRAAGTGLAFLLMIVLLMVASLSTGFDFEIPGFGIGSKTTLVEG